jgi:hypothetical protein
MGRLRILKNIDGVILCIDSLLENRCSLSDEQGVKALIEAKALLQKLKGKKGKTNEEILNCVVQVVVTLTKFLLKGGTKEDQELL